MATNQIVSYVKATIPTTWRPPLRRLRSRWEAWRFGLRCVRATLCQESFRFKIGYGPAPTLGGKFWEDDRHLMKQFCDAISSGQTVIDVGAFVGQYTLLAARKVGATGRVLAFEPVPATYRILIEHLLINNLLDRVDVWPLAVGQESEPVKIYFQEHDPVRGHNSIYPLAFSQKGLTEALIARTVPCISLGSFLESMDIKPDVIKIDVEGDEIGVLQSLINVLKGETVIFCELHPHLWQKPETQSSLLRTLLMETHRYPETLRGEPTHIFQHEPVILRKKK